MPPLPSKQVTGKNMSRICHVQWIDWFFVKVIVQFKALFPANRIQTQKSNHNQNLLPYYCNIMWKACFMKIKDLMTSYYVIIYIKRQWALGNVDMCIIVTINCCCTFTYIVLCKNACILLLAYMCPFKMWATSFHQNATKLNFLTITHLSLQVKASNQQIGTHSAVQKGQSIDCCVTFWPACWQRRSWYGGIAKAQVEFVYKGIAAVVAFSGWECNQTVLQQSLHASLVGK